MKEQKEQLDKVVDKILAYKPEKKKREKREDLYEVPLKNLQEVENDRRKNS